MAEVILVPVQGDATVAAVANSVQADWCGPNFVVTTLGQNQLGGLENAPSSLYVVGHGNWGLGVGTHATHYGGRRLAQHLVNEGLNPAQTDLHIYVVACNSGVAMQRLGPFAGRRAPYVERLAYALAALQFTNTTVHGYAGFVSIHLASTLKLNRWTHSVSAQHGQRVNLGGSHNREVLYTVIGGVVQQTTTRNWRGTSSLTSTQIA